MRACALCFLVALSVLVSSQTEAGVADDGDAAFHRKDYSYAMKLLMPLALKGNSVAELDVGIMYYGGLGVTIDRVEGVKWFMASAKQGALGAEVDLGIAYATGEGIQQDRSQAYLWFSLAAEQGNALGVQYRDHIATELTPDQIQHVRAMAKTCRTSNYGTCGQP